MTPARREVNAHLPLHEALELLSRAPDPVGLEHIVANNGAKLRMLAKLICVMVWNDRSAPFYLGSDHLGQLLGEHQQVVIRWIHQLERIGVIRRVWTGRPCRRDPDGNTYKTRLGKNPHSTGYYRNRASEYLFLGLPSVPTAPSSRNLHNK